MSTQNLIIYKFDVLYQILKELDEHLTFKIIQISDDKILNNEINKFTDYLIITNKKKLDFKNQFFFEDFPIKINKLIEKLNIEFLKQKFTKQAQLKASNYLIDLNSRKMSLNNLTLKLTEKEVNTIIYLLRNNNPTSIKELQKTVWGYQSDIETHTVETHIYRLRKKILNKFQDDNFLISRKEGYLINKN